MFQLDRMDFFASFFSIVVLSWNTCFICYKAFACCFLFKFFGFFSVCLYSVFYSSWTWNFQLLSLDWALYWFCYPIWLFVYIKIIISLSHNIRCKINMKNWLEKKEPNKLKCNKNELKINAKVCLLFWNSENWLHLPKWNHYTLKRVHTILCYT